MALGKRSKEQLEHSYTAYSSDKLKLQALFQQTKCQCDFLVQFLEHLSGLELVVFVAAVVDAAVIVRVQQQDLSLGLFSFSFKFLIPFAIYSKEPDAVGSHASAYLAILENVF